MNCGVKALAEGFVYISQSKLSLLSSTTIAGKISLSSKFTENRNLFVSYGYRLLIIEHLVGDMMKYYCLKEKSRVFKYAK